MFCPQPPNERLLYREGVRAGLRPSNRRQGRSTIHIFRRSGAPLPAFEKERQRAVDALPNAAGSSPALDQIAAAAAGLCGVASGLVTVIDGGAMLTPGRFNSGLRDVARAESMCQHAIMTPDEVLCVPDLLREARFARLGVARGPEAIRFYAGAPLLSPDGQPLGMLCVLDPEPQAAITDDQRRALKRLAKLALLPLLTMPAGKPAAAAA